MVERILTEYDHAFAMKHIALHYFNAASADPDDEIGEVHEPEAHLIPLVLDTATGRMEYVEICSDEYHRLHGTAIRDYIHVTYLADAYIKALVFHLSAQTSEQFNLNYETVSSVKQVIKTIKHITDRQVRIVHGWRRVGDPDELIADANKVVSTLGWTTRYSQLDKIVETAFLMAYDQAQDGRCLIGGYTS